MTDLQSLITAAETGTTAERAEALCKLGGMALELAKAVVEAEHALVGLMQVADGIKMNFSQMLYRKDVARSFLEEMRKKRMGL